MDAERALAEAVAFLQGVGNDIGPDQGARLLVEQLAARGFSVQANAAPILTDVAPETLRRVRLSLGFSMGHVAAEAGLKQSTVRNAETGETRPHMKTLTAVAEALVRLGARRPDGSEP